MADDPARPYHHGNLRTALLQRAEEVLAADGVDGLSLRGIARDVGVSHAAPRRHFADRQALLDALAEAGFVRLREELDAAASRPASGFAQRFVHVALAYVGFATERAALLDVMFAGKHRPDAAASLLAAGARAFEAPLAVVAAGQAAGEVVAGDPEGVATASWAAIHGLAALANAGLLDRAALPGLVEVAVERLVLGLRPRD